MAPTKAFRIIQEEKLLFSWDDIDAKTVPGDKCNFLAAKDPGRMILDHVSGEAKNGEILAILGESGAGKTTLLNLLSGRTCQGIQYDGKVKINRQDIKSTTLTRLTSFVKQFEDYIPYLTVKEHLLFYAMLKIRNAKQKEILEKIDSILTEFMLQKCSNSLIGIPGYMRTLSGGEYKRLVLATETISDTPIVLCDEPTTGLDSRMAYDVVCTLKYLANLGKVIICTIHQPSSGIVAMFDRIMLMHDARVAYAGQVPDAIIFFETLGYKMKNNTNPADFFIKCLAIVPGNEESCKKRTKIICDSFKDAERNRSNQVSDEERSSFKNFLKNSYITTGIQSSFWTQMKVLAERELKMKVRVNKRILGNISIALFFAVTIAICYQKQELTDVGGQNMVGIVFNIVISLGVFPLFHESIGLALQLQLVYKEQQKYLYSSSAFLLSVFLIAILWYTVTAIPVLSIMYFSGGLPYVASTFLSFYLIICLLMCVSISFGLLFTIFVNQMMLIIECLSPIMNFVMIANGFFLNMKTIPFFLVWLTSCNFFTRSVEAAMICLFSAIPHLDCVGNTTKCISSGDEILQHHGYEKENFYINLWIVLLCGVIFVLASHVLFYIKSKFYKE